MKLYQKLFLFFAICAIVPLEVQSKPKIFYKTDEIEFAITGKIENEIAGDFNATLFNSKIHDSLMANQTVINLSFVTKISDFVDSKATFRNKIVWGNHKVIKTDAAWLKNLDSIPDDHFHKIGPNMLWVRELWTKLDLTNIFKMTNILPQHITIGSFSFQLGRGIALGDAYAVNPASLGFFQDNAVDQYAWGVKLSGGLIKDLMKYDLYCSVLDNKSTSLTDTNFPTQAKAFGTAEPKVRGAGKITFVTAGHFVITPVADKVTGTELSFEPYFMSYHDAEQKVEYFCDSKAHLSTIGFAVEFSSNRFEFGVDCATNIGYQYVRGWDRNRTENINRSGVSTFVYTDIYDVDPKVVVPTSANKVVYDPSNTTQTKAINAVTPGALSNGQQIAGTNLYNSVTRYRLPYTTKFGGFMVLADMSFWMIPKELAFNVTGGIATGDQNPNANLADPLDPSVDGNYNAFIPFQEIYSGKRVQSFFNMLSGFVRPLSLVNTGNQYAGVVDNFSNLRFWGAGISYAPQHVVREWNINPNIICYWQDIASNMFDRATGKSIEGLADRFLGTEANIYFKADLADDVFVSAGAALFVPGQHFIDIEGKPTNGDQRKALDSALAAGSSTDTLPLIGSDTAYSVSMAVGYLF